MTIFTLKWFHDDACHAAPFLERRAKLPGASEAMRALAALCMRVDRFHMRGHCPKCKASKYNVKNDSAWNGINMSACEQQVTHSRMLSTIALTLALPLQVLRLDVPFEAKFPADGPSPIYFHAAPPVRFSRSDMHRTCTAHCHAASHVASSPTLCSTACGSATTSAFGRARSLPTFTSLVNERLLFLYIVRYDLADVMMPELRVLIKIHLN